VWFFQILKRNSAPRPLFRTLWQKGSLKSEAFRGPPSPAREAKLKQRARDGERRAALLDVGQPLMLLIVATTSSIGLPVAFIDGVPSERF